MRRSGVHRIKWPAHPARRAQEEQGQRSCADLEYIASSGLRILLDVLKKNKARGHKVILRNVNDDIKNVFNITGFINLFEFE